MAGIGDPGVEEVGEREDEGCLDGGEFVERQGAGVELTVEQLALDDR
jgi:hypothetical protein